MTRHARPNEPCPCGSGWKYKKCCGARAAATSAAGSVVYTQADRASAWAKLKRFIDQRRPDERGAAAAVFWGFYYDRQAALPPHLVDLSIDVHQLWFVFDYRLANGKRIIDEFLPQAVLNVREQSFLQGLRQSTMRPYEVIEIVPGISLALCDILEGTVVTVHEQTASRELSRHQCIAARVIPCGLSGRPQVELGALPIPPSQQSQLLATVKQRCHAFRKLHPDRPVVEAYRQLPPLFHQAWLAAIFDPVARKAMNSDGEELMSTRVSFAAVDNDVLRRALDAAKHEGIRRLAEDAWMWSGPNAIGEEVLLGMLKLHGEQLAIEVDSIPRAARARTLVERLAGPALQYRGTTHDNPRRASVQAMTAGSPGPKEDSAAAPAPSAVDAELVESLILDNHARNYRRWLDEPLAGLDGHSPRDAAKRPLLRPHVAAMLRGLEVAYQQTLKVGEPAYDPSWMWDELGLGPEADASHPPPLAHERVAERFPGLAKASRAAAERHRVLPSFSDAETTLGEDALRADPALQRFLGQAQSSSPSADAAGHAGTSAAPYVSLLVNLDLHRRKVFWVDEALAYMLAETDLEVTGREVRVPFPSFAIVFTDRGTLSLGERLLARRPGDPLRGQILRVATVYVTERRHGDARSLSVVFAFDALGADLPSLVRHEVPADEDTSLRAFLDAISPPANAMLPLVTRDTSPARGLLRLVLNAILYATSAGVTPEVRPATAPVRRQAASTPPPRSEDAVFYLPGKIDIRQLRTLQALQRAPGGRAILVRFMVRGHWRRPQKGWSDQRLRWIEPYWKGPDMATVIEKAYRLKP